jgi:hypothetical protein
LLSELAHFGKLKETKLLYRFDPKNTPNFLDYVAGSGSLLLAVRTEKKIVGAFSNCREDKGFMFAAKEGQFEAYGLIAGSKPVVNCTKDRVIVGRSELRVERGSLELSCNFALNGCFESRGHRVNDFLEEGELTRKVKMQTYEIYRLTFEGE